MHHYPGDIFRGLASLAVLSVIGVVILALHLVVAFLLYEDYKRIPPVHRKLEPGLVWLLVIPCVPIVWNFFVFPKLSQSFKSYFSSTGDLSVGDCSEGLGLAYAICSAASIVPYLGCLTGIAALVLLIIYLMKANELKNRIPATF
jgi:hypothetical protein